MVRKPYYQNNRITLYHGDCREILPQLSAESFDFVLTDPPYLVSYAGRWGSDYEPIEGDDDPSWVSPVYAELFRLLRNDALCLTFYGWPQAEIFLTAWRRVGFRPVSVFVLAKNRIGLGYYSRSRHEQAFLLAKGHPPKPARALSNVLHWECSDTSFHPNQEPEGALAKLLDSFTKPNSFVLDPFAGSGSALLAARSCGLQAVGIEIEERFCEVAAMRLSQEVLDLDHAAPISTPLGEQP